MCTPGKLMASPSALDDVSDDTSHGSTNFVVMPGSASSTTEQKQQRTSHNFCVQWQSDAVARLCQRQHQQ